MNTADLGAGAATAPRAAVMTLGCRLNHAESALLHERLRDAGYAIVAPGQPADLGVINTCTVTGEADAKSRKTIRAFIRRNPQAFVAVIGCMSQLHAQQVAKIEGVDLVIGNTNKLNLVDHLGPAKNTEPVVICSDLPETDFTIPVADGAGPTRRANLKIQEGCDCMCSYCVVPLARGKPRSRRFANLVEEAEALVRRGVKEIILTGVNIGTYDCDGRSVLHVVDRLAEIEGLARVRVSSIELSNIPDGLVQRMADPWHALVPFLHLPLQSGCDRTLEAMRRTYTAEQFGQFITRAREIAPDLCIGADVIVGFPGETDEDFDLSCRFVFESPIDYTHVFRFSPRAGTLAAQMPGRVQPEETNRRSRRMRGAGSMKKAQFHQRHVGRTYDVLFELQSAGKWYGYTPNYIRVAVRSSLNLENIVAPVTLREPRGELMNGVLAK